MSDTIPQWAADQARETFLDLVSEPERVAVPALARALVKLKAETLEACAQHFETLNYPRNFVDASIAKAIRGMKE